MKYSIKISVIITFIVGLTVGLNSCKKKDPPSVTTSEVSQITQTGAVSGGNVSNNGGAEVNARGVCWGTSQNPVLGSNTTTNGTGNGSFISNITGLTPNTLYYVKAYASNSEGTAYGNQLSFTTLPDLPVAAFTASSTTITAGQSVQFTDQSTNNPASWSWNFGDGNTSTSQSPSHLYSAPGTYTVTLTVTNNAGSDTETKTNYIKVNPVVVTPVAAFTASATIITAGQSIQFTDQSANNPTSWSWNFGDGSTSTTKSPAHVYSTAGIYTVTLTVTNSTGSDTETKTNYITVTASPVAAFTASATAITPGQSIQFTDQSTNNPSTWSWNFGDGTTSTLKNPAHAYSTAGTYTVILTVTNIAGSDSETKTNYISVGNNPIAAFSVSATIVMAGQSVQFTDQSINSPENWSWNFGDGSNSTTKNPAHTYQSVGVYTVSLTVGNASGSDTETKTDLVTVVSHEVFDIENNSYLTVIIGNQVWMAENLKTTKLNDGTAIPNVTNAADWYDRSLPAYCWYNNSISNKDLFGGLYNWHTLSTGKLCPTGWKIPSDEDWKVLEIYLGMTSEIANTTSWRGNNEGAKLKSTVGWYSGGNGTNVSGFTADPAGYRDANGNFLELGTSTYYWTNTAVDNSMSWFRGLSYTYSNIRRGWNMNNFGYTVRCIKQ